MSSFFLSPLAMFRRLPFLLALLATGPVGATLTDNLDGTVSDSLTGLTWDQCSWGTSGEVCDTGQIAYLAWNQALAAAHTANSANYKNRADWRLPNPTELESIVDLQQFNPAIDNTAFPNTIGGGGLYWTSTTYVPDQAMAWFILFGGGFSGGTTKSSSGYVRLVRGGQGFAAFDGQGDFVPDAFTFADQSGLLLASPVTSAAITIAGIDTVSPITVSGGSYAVNGGSYTSAAGTVRNGDSVSLRHTSAASGSSNVSTTLTIGGVSGSFTSTTIDTTPPVLSALGISGTPLRAPVLSATSNEAANGYWLVLVKGAGAPSAAQLKLGRDAQNQPALSAGSAAMTALSAQTFSLGNLNSGRPYQLYFVASDAAGNDTTVRQLDFSLSSGLNDSGQATCADASSNGQPCAPAEPTGFGRQDGRYGRDAAAAAGALYKFGAGSASFDFTKIANDGSDLPATAALGDNPGDWACTRDNTTGLTWEVKTTSGVRGQNNTYVWSSTTLRSAANSAALCGFTDWRLPNAAELVSLLDLSRSTAPLIDGDYFPNTPAYTYWASDASSGGNALQVTFAGGAVSSYPNTSDFRMRVVRGGL
jgi:hypothetical protein